MRRANWIAAAAAAAWYVLAWSVIRPLADGPVVDGWLYRAAVNWFLKTGTIRFAGFTDTMPVAQVVYGAAWGRLFGTTHPSLDIAGATLGAAGVTMLYALARRCGAGAWQAALAAALLAGNPCYLFLSFSFMTEVPYVAALLAALLAFSAAEGAHETLWLWVSAAFGVIAFLVRPFGGAVIAGCAGAIVLYDFARVRRDGGKAQLALKLAPFALALLLAALAFYWLTVLRPPPWDLRRRASLVLAVFSAPLGTYVGAGAFGVLLYLGAMSAPLALLQLATIRVMRALALAVGIFVAVFVIAKLYPHVDVLTKFTCFAGSPIMFYLHGEPPDMPIGPLRWALTVLGSAGGAGIVIALVRTLPHMNRATTAVMLTAAIFWAAIFPLWLFNDRYYLPLVPAGCVLLALAPMPAAKFARAAAVALALVLALTSLAGLHSYQRGLAAVSAARDELLLEGVPRRQIDAGYPINSEDEYRYVSSGIDTPALEAGIPMLTTLKVAEYTISTVQPPGTEIVRTIEWPGPLGFGTRKLYVFRRLRGSRAN
jgi:hypothetical protein